MCLQGDLLEEANVLQWLKDEAEDEEDEAPVAVEEVVKETLKPKPSKPKASKTEETKQSTSTVDKTSASKTKSKPAPTKAKSESAPAKDVKKEKKTAAPSETAPKKPIKISKGDKEKEANVVPEPKLGGRQQPPAKNDTGKFCLNFSITRNFIIKLYS